MPGAHPTALVEILLVEDCPDEALLMEDALKESNLTCRVHTVEDGEEAMDYLWQRGAYALAPPPDLILLDLHLPRKNGFEVLAEIKEDGRLRRIPVVVLTSSASEQSYVAAYELHANCCVKKPTELDQFALVVKRIEAFWRQTVHPLPYKGP